VIGAAGLAVLSAALFLWASLNFNEPRAFFDTPLPISALGLMYIIGAPFASAGLAKPGGMRDYPLLFDTAWAILVRYLAGWLFVAVVWGIVFLSDALLSLVGVTVIQNLLDIEPVPFALTGLLLGLSLAIMHELRAYISPFLVLRLFRILLPAITFVVAVFLIALPLRGFSALFGGFSVAGTLMAVAIAAITLITSALDRTTDEEVQTGFMRLSVRVMAVLLIPLCVAAAWAIWLRVDAYGWTPDRLAGAVTAVLLVVYAFGYGGVAVIGDWARGIRRINLLMAVVIFGVAALWLTPIINAESISTKSQVARFEAGLTKVEALPLWTMKNDWGKPGQAGLAKLRTLDDAELVAELKRLDEVDTRYEFERLVGSQNVTNEMRDTLLARLVVLPPMH
jgi:hypothetical protein